MRKPPCASAWSNRWWTAARRARPAAGGQVARQSPVAIRTIKPLIQGARERAPNTWLPEERERFVDLFDAQDTREGVNAFLEKRDPKWRNC